MTRPLRRVPVYGSVKHEKMDEKPTGECNTTGDKAAQAVIPLMVIVTVVVVLIFVWRVLKGKRQGDEEAPDEIYKSDPYKTKKDKHHLGKKHAGFMPQINFSSTMAKGVMSINKL